MPTETAQRVRVVNELRVDGLSTSTSGDLPVAINGPLSAESGLKTLPQA